VRRHDGVLLTSRFQLEANASNRKGPARVERLSPAGDRSAIDLGTVRTAQVLYEPFADFPRETNVMTRDLGIVNDYVTIVSSPEEKAGGGQLELLPGKTITLSHQPRGRWFLSLIRGGHGRSP
jgi:hypothetical protein